MSMYAPDIANGFATVGDNKANSWRTEVRSVLLLNARGSEEPRAAYLTHECRAENVSGTRIFDGRLYEFMVVKSWSGVFNLRHGSFNFGVGGEAPNSTYEKSDLNVNVFCPAAPVRELSFEETLSLCQQDGAGRLFMRIDYDLDEHNWSVFVPARYVNFQNSAFPGKSYLQPISGYTLIFADGRFRIAYVAAYVDQSTTHIEFVAREPLPFLSTKHSASRVRRLLSPFSWLFDKLLRTDEFHAVRALTGSLRFFTYVE